MRLSVDEIKRDWDVPFRYVFSGLLGNIIHDMLVDTRHFKPLSMLEIPKDMYSIRKICQWKDEGFVGFFLLDSGAFSVHTGNYDLDQDSYCEIINSLEGKLDAVAQLDTIPGICGIPKTPDDYERSAQQSWEDFLYLRERIYDPKLLMPVFHSGEDTGYLKNMLEFRDSDGEPLSYIGLAPASDTSLKSQADFLREMYRIIHESSNPTVRTHLYGYTSLMNLSQFPCYSADSTTHRRVASLNKVQSYNFGTISTIQASRVDGNRTGMSFFAASDSLSKAMFREELDYLGIDLEFARRYGFEGDDVFDWIPQSYSARCVISVCNLLRLAEEKFVYTGEGDKMTRKLF